MLVDMHCHTDIWSPDGKQSVELLLRAAKEQGLAGVAVTDHSDHETVEPSGRRWVFDVHAYKTSLAEKRKPPSTLRRGQFPGLLIGIEFSYFEQHAADINRLIRHGQLDFSIISLHEYRGVDPILQPHILYRGELPAIYERILHALAETAENIPSANIIGHYDFFSRYAPFKACKICYRHCPAAFDRLFRAMIRNDQALEINTGTVEALHFKRGYALQDAMPDTEILSRYRELGGRRITIGDDAHRPDDVGRCFAPTLRYLKSQGIDQLFWMEDRVWHAAPFSDMLCQ